LHSFLGIFESSFIGSSGYPYRASCTVRIARTSILARHKVGIRQIITDDPDLYPEPKMLVVVDGKLPQKAVLELRRLGLDSISFK